MIACDAAELETKLRQRVIHIRQKEVELFTDQFGVLAGTGVPNGQASVETRSNESSNARVAVRGSSEHSRRYEFKYETQIAPVVEGQAGTATFLGSLGFAALMMSTNFLETGEKGDICSDLRGCDAERRDNQSRRRGFLFNNYAAINVFFGLTALSILCNFACVFISMYCMIFGPELAIRGREREQKIAIKGMYKERSVALRFFWAGFVLIVFATMTLGWLKYPEHAAEMITVIFGCLLLWSRWTLRALWPQFEYVDAEGLDCSGLTSRFQTEPDSLRDSLLGASGNFSERSSSSTTPSGRFSELDVEPHRRGFRMPWRRTRAPPLAYPHARRSANHTAAAENAVVASEVYVTDKSAPLMVDGERLHALLAEGELKLFSFDGALKLALDVARTCELELDARDGSFFHLRTENRHLRCAGSDLDDTQNWIRAFVANLDADATDETRFSDGGDDGDDDSDV